MKTFSVSLICLGLSSLSIVCAQPFRPGGPFGPPGGGMGGPGMVGPGMGGGPGMAGGPNNGKLMTEAEFMGMPAPANGQKLELAAADQTRYDEYVKNFNSGQSGNQNSPGQNNFGQGGPGNGPGFGGPGFGGPGFGPGGPGFGGPGGPGRGMGPGGPGGPWPGGPGGPNGPGGPFGNGGPFGGGPNGQNFGANAQNSMGNDYNAADAYPSSGGGNQEAIAMVNEVISDGNYSPQEKVALKSSASEIAREFVQHEEERAGYDTKTFNGEMRMSFNSQAKVAPLFGNLILLSLLHIFRWLH